MPNTQGKQAVLFKKNHERFKKGAFYWLEPKQAQKYISNKTAVKHTPDFTSDPKDPFDSLPGKDELLEAGVTDLEQVMDLFEDGKLQTVNGIGPATEKDIIEYLTRNSDE